MPDYSKGKIYAIKSPSCDKFYIGSTCQTLSKRMNTHKSHYKMFIKGLLNYTRSYDLLMYSDAFIELIEDYPCQTRFQLEQRERFYIETLNDKVVNNNIPTRKWAEYYQDHKTKLNSYNQEYHQQNKERIRSQKSKYNEENKDKIKLRKSKHKQENRESYNQHQRDYVSRLRQIADFVMFLETCK